MRQKKAELLAPAGSYESLRAAVNAGADAVYIGGSRFGARAYADNPDEETMVRAIAFAHLHNVRVYLTVNTLFKEKELSQLYGYLKPYYEAGLDAVLVQDLGIFQYLHAVFPDLPLHVSTQMTVTGAYSAAALQQMGAARVVPARELSLEEIRGIAAIPGLEVETFVHGALCYCYSGQCLFSSLIGGRSGNRGRCAQTCRLPFDVVRPETAERGGELLNKRSERYPLSLKDLNTLELLPDILEAGVCSLKIEGRMKSPRYTAGVVSVYRKYLDLYETCGRAGYHVDPKDNERLLALFNRGGQTAGYYRQHNGRDMVVLKEKPAFRAADQALYDYLDQTYVAGEKKEAIRGSAYFKVGEPARLYADFPVPAGGPLREALTAGAAAGPAGVRDRNPGAETRQKKAEPASVRVSVEGAVVEAAKNAPMDEARLRRQLVKTGDFPFVFESLEITADENGFIPVSVLNELRRDLLEKLRETLIGSLCRTAPIPGPSEAGMPETERQGEPAKEKAGGRSEPESAGSPEAKPAETEKREPEFTALVNSREQFEAILRAIQGLRREEAGKSGRFGVYLASEEFAPDEWAACVSACHTAGASCYLMLPRIFRRAEEMYFLRNMDTLRAAGFDAAGVPSMEEPGFFRQQLPGLPLYFDHSMYAMNHLAAQAMRNYGADRLTIPLELNEKEILEAGLSGELVVYGRLPVMVSAQCIQRTAAGCTRRPDFLCLKDRMGKEFPVRNQCRFCYNTIYNEAPLSLHGLLARVKKIAPAALRLSFTTESPADTGRLFTGFWREWQYGRDRMEPVSRFTRGHYKRGVE